jgi:DNA-directed RNA polymerase subunit RPC12/RpoP
LVRHVCANCGATVTDEEFCPTCGSWIDPLSAERPPEDYEEFELGEGPPAGAGRPADRGGTVVCPSCGAPNPAGNRHCEDCGARLMQGPLPTAPRPAVQATAGVRAVIAISALLLGVILIALLFNLFRDGDTATTTTAATATDTTNGGATTLPLAEPEPLRVLSVTCAPEGLGGAFGCSNLVNDKVGQEFQLNWNELPENEKTVVITLIFDGPKTINRIDWYNIADPVRFQQNFRARSVTAEAEDSISPVALPLEDSLEPQQFTFRSIRTNRLVITVRNVYLAQVVNDQIWDELAIDEIVVVGSAFQEPVTTTEATSTTAP